MVQTSQIQKMDERQLRANRALGKIYTDFNGNITEIAEALDLDLSGKFTSNKPTVKEFIEVMLKPTIPKDIK